MSSRHLSQSTDRYPTRLDTQIDPIAREEPTVWGSAANGPLAAADLDSMASNGYMVRRDAVEAAWLPALTAELDRVAATADPRDPRIIREPGGSIRSVFQPHLFSDLISEVVTLDTVLPVARQLLGSDVYLHQARINMMPGFTGTGFYWHSDFETWHAEDGMPEMRAVSCSIALTQNFPYNGSLMVMPGSHRVFYPCVGATPRDNHASSLVKQEIGVPSHATLTAAADRHGIDQVTGPAGTALWFDCNIMHGSGSNITPYPRSNIFLVFNSVENRLLAPYRAETPRPEYLAARTSQPFSATALTT
ncbi:MULTISPECIES: ectoine hydroxylase [Mycolicibacterium]|uniref:Ectoine hydroxylase n=1 Tax=Mycolicibacterium vanbaalenii (strain DSM 7251 / JCM 13017 / BCRC 16820 / KCTC 9966 / NRRL B-24157 / PYR-1) TaxID=350058 RepID=A1TFU2_MYCVP|nr:MULTISPECIES: ectoine hydroxylase [Mycolicibacterium]ABM16042.1 ectoine hydroxylase [Mycolicibacterium vanbaalenii PYR-1]PQP39824.1 ectoine hydroxylase [Mycolicibacterium austroafricanum]